MESEALSQEVRNSEWFKLEAVEQENPKTPGWFGEAALLGKYWHESGLLNELIDSVFVTRGRMGRYEVCDFVLLLNAYAVSGHKSLKDFFQELNPFKDILMSIWGREKCPVASSLSRFLADVEAPAVESLRLLFESNSNHNAIKFSTGLGMSDRTGDRYLVFDVDGTVCAVRRRDLSDPQDYPQARRRSEAASAPGYRGRKRGEAVRTRTTICHAQTGEWLGTYGGAGNGEVKEDLERSLQRISNYLKAQNLKEIHGIVRLDGLYGTPQMASLVQKNGLGYVMRCRDYHLLEHLEVQARIKSAASWDWQTVNGNDFQKMLDIGYIEELGRGYSAPMRLIVVRTPEKLHPNRVGKSLKGEVYELFMTSQSASSLNATDVLNLYYGRGGFERRLFEEDQEQQMDRWCSWTPCGQEFWQILNQWVWNWRLWMGWHQQNEPKLREILWAEAEEFPPFESLEQPKALPPSLWLVREKYCTKKTKEQITALEAQSNQEQDNIYEPMKVSTEWGQGLGVANRFGNDDFKVVDEETLLCPAGHTMYRRTQQIKANGDLKMQFGINPKTCQKCSLKRRCLAPNTKGKGGRKVTVIRRKQAQAQETFPICSAIIRSVFHRLAIPDIVPQPVIWRDVAASRLRRSWRQSLASQQVELKRIEVNHSIRPDSSEALLKRHQISHHRLSWLERQEKNARTPECPCWLVVLYGESKQLLQALHRLIHTQLVTA